MISAFNTYSLTDLLSMSQLLPVILFMEICSLSNKHWCLVIHHNSFIFLADTLSDKLLRSACVLLWLSICIRVHKGKERMYA